MRPLGGMVLVVGGLWCAWRLWRGCGPLRTLVVGIGFLAAFALSHPLGEVIGAWPAVIAVSAAAGLLAYAVGRPVTA